MASPTQQTRVWASSERWWRTGNSGILHSMGLQRVGHDWATELNWTDVCNIGVPQYVRQMLTNMKGEINSNTIIVGTFNTELTLMDTSTKQKISKETHFRQQKQQMQRPWNGNKLSCCAVAQSHPTLCDPMECSTPGFPVHHHLPEPTQTHVHRVGDAIQPSHPLLSPSPPALNLSQHQGLFQWVSSSHQVAKVLKLITF